MTRALVTAAILVVPFWVAAYLVAGWTGVGIMAVVGLLAEILIFGSGRKHSASGDHQFSPKLRSVS